MKRIICLIKGHQLSLRYKTVDGDRRLRVVCDRCGAELDIKTQDARPKRRTVADEIHDAMVQAMEERHV